MTLDDLKTGMIVKTRDGLSHIVMRGFNNTWGDILAGLSDSKYISNTWSRLSEYTQDMKIPGLPNLDIMEVYITVPYSVDIPDKLLWKRDKYKEVTMSDIEEKFGCKVRIIH